MNRFAMFLSLVIALGGGVVYAAPPTVMVKDAPEQARLTFEVDGHARLSYVYGDQWAIPHLYPVRSPTGKQLTVQVPDPYPHHHSLWIAEKIKLAGHKPVNFYHDWRNESDKADTERRYKHFIDHRSFIQKSSAAQPGPQGRAIAELTWTMNGDTPVVDERRSMKVTALGEGEYLLDLSWTLTASYGQVRIASDKVHYAWPYVRIHPQFSGKQGGTITASNGATGQKQTDGQHAKWIDYSNTVEGTTEGLAIFIKPDGQKHKWLTRAYGTFGPRRHKELHGTNFKLEKGESISGQVGILVHRGDVETGQVAERYQQYIQDKW
jgi:hypothetical protein